jgi:hypothetical protein
MKNRWPSGAKGIYVKTAFGKGRMSESERQDQRRRCDTMARLDDPPNESGPPGLFAFPVFSADAFKRCGGIQRGVVGAGRRGKPERSRLEGRSRNSA